MKIAFHRSLALGSLVLCLIGVTGCQSGRQPGSSSHATVVITGRSPAEIRHTTTTVFAENGYGAILVKPEEMIFDRPGSRRDQLKWGDVAGGGVIMRVKVQVSRTPTGDHLLKADAYAVQDVDDPFFQSENRNIMLNHRPYQKILNTVAKRLK